MKNKRNSFTCAKKAQDYYNALVYFEFNKARKLEKSSRVKNKGYIKCSILNTCATLANTYPYIKREKPTLNHPKIIAKIKEARSLSLEEFLSFDPEIFEKMTVFCLGSMPNILSNNDKGIDGTLKCGSPIQVKKTKKTKCRPTVQQFFLPCLESPKKRGVIIALSFSKECIKEAARIKERHGVTIKLLTLEELVKNKGRKLWD